MAATFLFLVCFVVCFFFSAGSCRQPLSTVNRDEDFVTPQPRKLRNHKRSQKRLPPKKAVIAFSSDEENSSEDGKDSMGMLKW